jgi:hypothetical protein
MQSTKKGRTLCRSESHSRGEEAEMTQEHRSLMGVVCAVTLLALGSVTTAKGQTTPTPTPIPGSGLSATPTASIPLPPPQLVLERTMQAFSAAGSVRATVESTYIVQGKGTAHSSESIGLVYHHFPARMAAHFQNTLDRPNRHRLLQSADFVQVGKRTAYRSDTMHWQCETQKPLGRAYLRTFALDGAMEKTALIGADSVNGIPAWHLRGEVPTSGSWANIFKSLPPIQEDIYVAQSDSSLLRSVERFTGELPANSILDPGIRGPAAVGVESIVDYGSYGVAVRVSLPQKCHG